MIEKPLLGKDLVNLSEVLPLDMPISLMIDPSNLCNFRCNFCPTGNKDLLGEYGRPKGSMSYELFKKIILDISNFQKNKKNKIKSLLLYKDGEPLVNKYLPDMISLAKEKKISDHIMVTTNASLLTEKNSLKILESNLDTLRVSVQSLKQNSFENVTRTKYEIDEIKENLKFFFKKKKEMNKKTIVIASYVDAENFDTKTKENFIKEYSEFTDRVIINPVMGWTRSDVYDWRKGVQRFEKKEIKACPDPFSRLSVNFDGTVSVCCVDWSHGTLVGDFKKETFDDVWNGEKLREFRILHLKGERKKIGPCSNCDYLKDKGDHDNIDHVCDKLIKVYS